MVTETICENSEIKNILDQDSLIGAKRNRAMVKGKLPNGFKDSSSTSKQLNIKFTNGLKRPKLNGPNCIDKKKKIKSIENGCIKQYKIKRCINNKVENEEKNENKCFRGKKITSEIINNSITNHDKISESGEINDDKNSFVANHTRNKGFKIKHLDKSSKSVKINDDKKSFVANHTRKKGFKIKHLNKSSKSRKMNGDKKSFVANNTTKEGFKTKHLDKSSESRKINGDENTYISSNIQNDLVTKHHDDISESREINDIENINVNNNTHENKLEMVSYINNLVNIVCYFSTIDPKNNYFNKTNYCKDISQNSTRNSSNLSNSTRVPQMTIENTKTISTNNELNQSYKVTCDDSRLNRSSSSGNLVIEEDSNNDSYLSKQIPNEVVNNSLQTKSNLNKSNTEEFGVKNIENNASNNQLIAMRNENINMNESKSTQNDTKSTDILQMKSYSNNNFNGIKSKTSTFTDYGIESYGNTNCKNTSDLTDSSNKSKMTNVVPKLVKKITKNSLPELETILNTQDLTFTEFEQSCSQMIFRQMKMFDKDYKCKNFMDFKNHEKSLSNRYKILQSQLSMFKSVLGKSKKELENKELSQMLKNTSSVDVQTKISLIRDSKKIHKGSVTRKNGDDIGWEKSNSKNAVLPLCSNTIKKKVGVLLDPNMVQSASMIEIDDGETISETVHSKSPDLPECTKITQKMDGAFSDSNMVQSASVIEIDDDETISETVHSKSPDLPKCTKITQKMVGALSDSNMSAIPSVIEIDDDETISETVHSKSPDLHECTKITQKMDGAFSDSNMVQSASVIEIDDDETISEIVNFDSFCVSKCTKITQKMDGAFSDSNMVQSASVIEIDDDETISETVHSKSPDLPNCTKITQKMDGAFSDSNMVQSASVIEIDDDETISETVHSKSPDLPKCTKITQKMVGALSDSNMSAIPSVIEIDDDETISETVHSISPDLPKCTKITQKMDGAFSDSNMVQSASVIEIDDDETISEIVNSDSSCVPKCTKITQKMVGALSDSNMLAISSVIEIDDDETISETVHSKSPDLHECTKITQKMDGAFSDSNMVQSASVIEIDDDETISETVNSDSSCVPKCTKITQKMDDALSASNLVQNASVIEIDDDEPIPQTVNSECSYEPKCTKITQKKVGILPVPNMVQNPSAIEIHDDEPISQTVNSGSSDEESKKQPPRLATQEHVDIISDHGKIIDSDIKLSDKQLCIKDSEKKEDSIKLSKEVIEPLVNITSNDVTTIDTIALVNQSCSKIIKEKSTNEQPSPNPSKLFKYLTLKRVPPTICIEQNNWKKNASSVTKNDGSSEHDLGNSNSSLATGQSNAFQSLTSLSTLQTNRSLVPKSFVRILPNLSNLKTSFLIRKTSYSRQSQVISSNCMKKKFSHKNISIRPYFFNAGKVIPVRISNVKSGLKTSTITISTAHQQFYSRNKIPFVLKPSSSTPVLKPLPTPLPVFLNQKSLLPWKELPPAPNVNVIKTHDLKNLTALLISWNMYITKTIATIKCYQIFYYQEVSFDKKPKIKKKWKQIGEVAATSLSMSCCISNFELDQMYHFIIRAVDVHNRAGPFSSQQSIFLEK